MTASPSACTVWSGDRRGPHHARRGEQPMSSRPREAPALGNGGTVDALPAGGLRRPTDLAMVANTLGPPVLALAVAATVTVAADHEGAYYVDVWGPLGLVLLAACAAVLAVRRAP